MDIWFLIALVEFVILLTIFLPPLIASLPKPAPKNRGGRVGIVANLEHTYKGIAHQPATVFEIHEADGNIYYAAFDYHMYEIRDGDTIEFWTSFFADTLVLRRTPTRHENSDGTISIGEETTRYYPLEKYRIVVPPELEPESEPVVAEEEQPSE